MTKLTPCVVFDLDDTLFLTVDINWNKPSEECFKRLATAPQIPSNVFLYHSMDYLINDPPEWAKNRPEWPKDIYFITARPEIYREVTLTSLRSMTLENNSFLDKRLLMGKDSFTTFESKEHSLSILRERGFEPALVFDNATDAISAYLEGGCDSVHLTIASEEDREVAKHRYGKNRTKLSKESKTIQKGFLKTV